MAKSKNTNVTISISEETRKRALEVSQKLFSGDRMSTTIAYLINQKHDEICKS